MREGFEVRAWDGAGRLGELEIPRSDTTVETPALLPVVNPHIRTVPPRRLDAAFGAQALITNGYIFYGSEEFRERALDEGLHDLLGFSGAIVTDSGSFQLSEYGDIDVDTREILAFQRDIGSDVGTPVDIPTPPDAARDRAEADLERTQERLELAESLDTGGMLVNAPIQGSTYPDLRRSAAEHAYGTGLDVFPVGAVVPLLTDYRFSDVVTVVRAAKRGLGADAPVHLFGAGHPMAFALAAALGCDLFDSAAYALYARDGRYLTAAGTERVADLAVFPCACPVCTEHEPADLRVDRQDGDRDANESEPERLLAEHNLHVSFAEMRRVREAIRRGTLFELLERRARGHPALLCGYRALLDDAAWLERTDPASKDAFFYLSAESARRPEVRRHHARLERLRVDGDRVLLSEGAKNAAYDETWRVVPPFGPFPRALSEGYPLTAEVPAPEHADDEARRAAVAGIERLADANPDVSFALAHRGWPERVLDTLPECVDHYRLGADGDPTGDGDRNDVPPDAEPTNGSPADDDDGA